MNTEIQSTCPRCQSSNLPGVKFCAQCGSRLTTLASIPPVVAAQVDPMARVREALQRGHAQVTGGDGHSSLDYELTFSDMLVTGPLKLQFAGTVTNSAGPSPGYSVSARMLPKSLAIQFGLLAAGAVILGFIPRAIVPNEMFVGAVAIALGLTVWTSFFEGPRRVRQQVTALIGAAPAGAMASGLVVASAPAPASLSVTGSAVDGGDVFAQLDRLAQMQATGLLSAEEVAEKKAELLSRI